MGNAFVAGLESAGRKIDGYEKSALAKIAGEKFCDCEGAKTEAEFARMAGEKFLLEYVSVTQI